MLGFMANGQGTGTEAARNAGFQAIKNTLHGLASVYMDFPKGNDDVIGVKRVTIGVPGQTQTLRFHSAAEEATYDVTFKQTAA